MVRLRVSPKHIDELDRAGNLMQSPFWGRLKQRAGWLPKCFTVRSDLGGGDLLALARPPRDPFPHLYVPHGPRIDLPPEAHGPFLEALSEQLRPHLAGRCIFVRYDLPWESPYDPADSAHLPPPRLRELRMNFATRRWNLRKAPTDVQPPDTIELAVQRSDLQLLASMKAKTRYNVRLSARRGVTVEPGGGEELANWYRIYRETSARKGIVAAGLSYFETLIELAGEGGRNDAKAVFLVAHHRGEIIGGIFVAAETVRAVYLYGATSYAHRHLMASYALQWEAMKWARALGCAVYDLHGVPPDGELTHPMHGLYRFKTGFGGRMVHRRGCWDYPYDGERYGALGGVEAAAPGFHVAG